MNKLAILYFSWATSFFFPVAVCSQIAQHTYWIQFTDKMHSTYSIDRPEEFLSERSLERRAKFNIQLDYTDLPVSEKYINGIREFNMEILGVSKWLNGVIIETTDSLLLDSVHKLPFVKKIPQKIKQKKRRLPDIEFTLLNPYSKFVENSKKTSYVTDLTQIMMLNGMHLHDRGYKGNGIHIAVIDAGFYRADSLPSLIHLWNDNQILGARDFTNQNYGIFEGDTHGMYVLSVMGGEIPGEYSGTAPEAGYWLLRSEVVVSEYPVEEYYWTIAAEYADSAGVDIINTSLGYSIFHSDPDKSYSYEDMDGKTTVVTNSADLAAKKGILVVASAGNEGNDPWKYITAPADGDSVLTVGSVNSFMEYSNFSSIGPTADGRTKPNVAAMGENTLVQLPNMGIGPKMGTSFSAPVISGMAACLWQAYPEMNNMEILHTIQESASQYLNPDDKLGYGIPDFMKAFKMLYVQNNLTNDEDIIAVYPTVFSSGLKIDIYSVNKRDISIDLYDISGRIMVHDTFTVYPVLTIVEIDDLGSLPAGIYMVHVTTDSSSWQQKVIKQ